MPKIILAAIDLDNPGAVLARAAQLAAEKGSWLVVLNVIDEKSLPTGPDLPGRTVEGFRGLLEADANTRLTALVAAADRNRRADIVVEFGSPHEVITRLCRERSAELVVLGAGGEPGKSLREKVLGSTADRVIRTSPVPVLVAKAGVPEPYQRTVVAIDYSQHSILAAKAARRFAPESRLQLVHAIEFPLAFEQSLLRAGTSQAELDHYRFTRLAEARARLSGFARDELGLGPVETRIIEGAPGPAIARLSKSKRVDLLALGSHGRGVVLSALMGSVAQRVLRESVCDVLVATKRS